MSHEKTEIAVTIGICTCRNPAGLRRLLLSLVEHPLPFKCRIVVVDNGGDDAGLALVENDARFSSFVAVSEPQPGIPFARNRLIDVALEERFQYLVMLDDDEWPASTAVWLKELVKTARETEASVVGGPVEPIFTEGTPAGPISARNFYKAGGRVKGGHNVTISSTANVLVAHSLLTAVPRPWFDEAFAATGGSDTEFFWRTKRLGHKHAIAPAALVFEEIPPERATARWLLRRAFRRGTIVSRVRSMTMGRSKAFAVEVAAHTVALLKAALLVIKTTGSPSSRLDLALELARFRGSIATFRGEIYEEYAPSRYR